MIYFKAVHHAVQRDGIDRNVLSFVNMALPSDRRIAVFGTSDEDTTFFIKLLGGVEQPRRGILFRDARVSFPVGSLIGFDMKVTLGDNLKHAARLYGANGVQFRSFVGNLLRNDALLDVPFKDLSAPIRRRIGTIVGFGLPFDCYVVNYGTGGARLLTQDAGLRALFTARAARHGMIAATQDLNFASEHFDMGIVLHEGRLKLFNAVSDAIDEFSHVLTQFGSAARVA